LTRLIAFTALLLSAQASGETLADRIVVNKAKRELHLMSEGKLLKSYRIALGTTPVGRKTRQGDGKTPEGLYHISGRNPGSAFHKSLRVSYPDSADRLRAQKEGV
jgi:murein L,D-transpeptidase YafK